MSIRVNVNGVITPPGEAKISVLDHGLLFGDSVYETLRTYQGKPFLFSRHFARLKHSADGIQLRLPWTKEETFEQVRRTLGPGVGEPAGSKQAEGVPAEPAGGPPDADNDCRIRLVVTRGAGQLSADAETCTDPTPIIIVVPLIAPPEAFYQEGVDVVISQVRRGERFADIKSGSLIHQVLAFGEAKSKRAFEAILLTAGGKLSDGITSNVYLVRDGSLRTPSHEAGIVEGITRHIVLELAGEMGIPVTQGLFDVDEIRTADEMFLTSTTREVVPIARVDGKPVGSGRPGPVTMRLLEAYRQAVGRLIEED